MSAPHFFADDVGSDLVVLDGAEAAHAARVLRIRERERVTVSDGLGTVVSGVVRSVSPQRVEVAVDARRTEAPPRPRLAVFPALPKGGKLELVVQKLTELGVDEIRPWGAERSVVRWDARKSAAAGDRLRAVAREASKQSRRARLPVVLDPGGLSDMPAVTVVLHEEESAPLHGALPEAAPDAVGVVVGPEGGLTADEVARFRADGATPVGLGSQILRAETASIVAATLVLARYGRIG